MLTVLHDNCKIAKPLGKSNEENLQKKIGQLYASSYARGWPVQKVSDFMPVQVNAIRFFSDLASSLRATLTPTLLHRCEHFNSWEELLCPTWRLGGRLGLAYHKKCCAECFCCRICIFFIWCQRPKLQSDKKEDLRLLTSLHFKICICKFNNL